MSSSAGRAQHEVVVVGGFGGLQAVRHLRRAPVSITLVDRRSFHLFQPLVYQVATGMLAAGEIAAPLRSVFKRDRNVRVILGEAGGRHATAASSGRCRAATRRRGAAAGPRRQCRRRCSSSICRWTATAGARPARRRRGEYGGARPGNRVLSATAERRPGPIREPPGAAVRRV